MLVRKYCLIFVYRMFIIVLFSFIIISISFFVIICVCVVFIFLFCYQARSPSDFCSKPNVGPCPRPFRRSTSVQAQGIAQCKPSPANCRERRPRPTCFFSAQAMHIGHGMQACMTFTSWPSHLVNQAPRVSNQASLSGLSPVSV